MSGKREKSIGGYLRAAEVDLDPLCYETRYNTHSFLHNIICAKLTLSAATIFMDIQLLHYISFSIVTIDSSKLFQFLSPTYFCRLVL